jgi:uncharacterized protein (TIGR03086 family)
VTKIPVDLPYAMRDRKRMPTIPDLRAYDAAAVRASVDLVATISVDDLGRPTPCSAWDLRALLAHMTVQHYGFAAAAEGNGASLAVWQPSPSSDPMKDYAPSAERVLQAFAGDVLDRPFDLGEIGVTVPGRMAISFHFIDYVVHSWDVAATLGRPFDLPDDLLRAAVPVADRVPTGERRLLPNASFAPALPTEADDDPLTHILRVLGRSPDFGK